MANTKDVTINLYTKQKFNVDNIILSNGEKLSFKMDISDADALDYTDITIDGKNLVINVYSSAETHTAETFMGKAVIKNYTVKDVITNTGFLRIFDSENTLIYDIREEFRIETDIDKNYKSKTVNASWINTDIDASAYIMYSDSKKTIPINDVSKKGLTIKLGNGSNVLPEGEFNNTVIASKYSDTITGGTGNDYIEGGTGNDTIKGGTGYNTVVYNKNEGNDVINLTKGEHLNIQLNGINAEDLTDESFNFVNGNLEISYLDDYGVKEKITLKGFGSKDITNNSTKTQANDSYVKLLVGGETIDLREKLYHIDVTKNYSGHWYDEELDASSYYNAKSKGLTISAGAGDDRLIGSRYNDSLTGGKGEDTFVFNIDADISIGEDIIKDGLIEDAIEFTGVEFEQLIFLKNGNNLEIKNTVNVNDKVTIQNFFKAKNTPLKEIVINGESYEIYKDVKLGDMYLTGKGTINGVAGITKILGSDSNDTIKALDTNDSIESGKGNDTIYGRGGNNTFIFSKGDGVDKIKDAKAGDIIKLKDMIWENIFFMKSGNSLVIANGINSGDRIIIENYYNTYSRIDRIVDSADNEYDIQSHLDDIWITGSGTIKGTPNNDTIVGSPSNDIIYGYDGWDTIVGAPGNDTLYGGNGYNTYAFEKGDGKDTVVGTSTDGYDILQFVDSDFNELDYAWSGNDLIIKYNDGIDSVRIKNYLKASNCVKLLVDKNFDPEDPSTIKVLSDEFKHTISSSASVVNGSEVDDEIWATNRTGVTVSGNGGNDTILTLTGSDTIYTYKKDTKNKDPFSNVYATTSSGNNKFYAQSAVSRLHGAPGNDSYYSYVKDQYTAVVEQVFNDVATGTNTLNILDASHNNLNVIFNINSAGVINNIFDESTRKYDFTGGIGFVDNESFENWKKDPTDTENIKGTFINFNTNGIKWDSQPTYAVKSSVSTITASDGYTVSVRDINEVILAVLWWLDDYKDTYTDTTSVFQNGTPGEINSLVGRYLINWEPPVQPTPNTTA